MCRMISRVVWIRTRTRTHRRWRGCWSWQVWGDTRDQRQGSKVMMTSRSAEWTHIQHVRSGSTVDNLEAEEANGFLKSMVCGVRMSRVLLRL